MTFDEHVHAATDRVVLELRSQVEAEIRALVQHLLEAASEERTRALAELREAAAVEARRAITAEFEGALREAEARLERARREGDQQVGDAVERAGTDAHQSELANTSRLLEWVRALDACPTLTDVLDTLGQAAGGEAPRTALLVVRGERLHGWSVQGFDIADARAIDLAQGEAGIAAGAILAGTRLTESITGPQDEGAAPLFARIAEERIATAIPVLVGGQPVAIVYAESPRADLPSAASRWPAAIELLVRHAGRCLEALTVTRALGGDAPLPRSAVRPQMGPVPGPFDPTGSPDDDTAKRYARLLVSEIRMFHESAVEAGRRERDLLARLGREIERARRLYEARVPAAVRDGHDYFEQELVRTLADGDRTVLGPLT